MSRFEQIARVPGRSCTKRRKYAEFSFIFADFDFALPEPKALMAGFLSQTRRHGEFQRGKEKLA
jgi:hypothetical protein